MTHATSWGNVLGFAGTNMRYVTIEHSHWLNNGIGIETGALQQERYPPPEDNVISRNDIFWNNFNYYYRAPFRFKRELEGGFSLPIGTGLLVFGSRRTVVTRNRIYGNFLAGAGMLQQLVLASLSAADEPSAKKHAAYKRASVLVGDEFVDDAYGLRGTDPNGHDIAYDGSGRANCVEEPGASNNLGGPFPACSFAEANTPNPDSLRTMITWAADPTFARNPLNREKYWTRSHHPAEPGRTPLVHCVVVKNGCRGQPSG